MRREGYDPRRKEKKFISKGSSRIIVVFVEDRSGGPGCTNYTRYC